VMTCTILLLVVIELWLGVAFYISYFPRKDDVCPIELN
jgi:hypothetical protein